MTSKQGQTSDIRVPVAFGSGLAATLLFISVQKGTVPAVLLAYLSPLPLMIATLGFGHLTGIAAVFVAVISYVALVIAATPQDLTLHAFLTAGVGGLIFAVCEGLPAWWLARLASLFPNGAILPWFRGAARDPAGRSMIGPIVVQAALIAFAIVAAILLIGAFSRIGVSAEIDKIAAQIAPLIPEMLGGREMPKSLSPIETARLIVLMLPPLAASTIFVVFLLNLWLAGRVVQVSQLLRRPWPDIARELRVPRVLGLVFVAAIGLCFVGGYAGWIASVAAAVLGVAFALQGLAVIHLLSRGARFRTSMLVFLYITLVLLVPWPLIVFAFVGLLEAAFSLRDRKAAAAVPPQ